MSQEELREDLQRAVQGAYLGGADIEEIKAALNETEQRVEAIAGAQEVA